MAKRINVKGLSISDVLDMDFEQIEKLSKGDLSAITGRLTAVAKKRIKRLEKSPLGESPALRGLLKSRGKEIDLTVKNKTRNQLMTLWKDTRNFVKAKTSTLKGYKSVINRSKEILKQKTGHSFETGQVGRMFDALHKAQEMGIVGGRGTAGSEQAVNLIAEYLNENPDADIDSIISGIETDYEDWYEDVYEETEDDNDGYEDIYDLFD